MDRNMWSQIFFPRSKVSHVIHTRAFFSTGGYASKRRQACNFSTLYADDFTAVIRPTHFA